MLESSRRQSFAVPSSMPCDRQQQVAEAARLAASYLSAGDRSADFIALLGHALLREDAESRRQSSAAFALLVDALRYRG